MWKRAELGTGVVSGSVPAPLLLHPVRGAGLPDVEQRTKTIPFSCLANVILFSKVISDSIGIYLKYVLLSEVDIFFRRGNNERYSNSSLPISRRDWTGRATTPRPVR